MRSLLALAVVPLACSAAPVAIQTTMLGIPMMQPLQMPECEIVGGVERLRRSNQILGAMASRVPVPYRSSSTSPCYKRGNDGAVSADRPRDELVTIAFPADRQPESANYDSVKVEVIDGVVQRIEFATLGIFNQDDVVSALRAKFGAPGVLRPERRQNGFGATFGSVTAFWTAPGGITVFFDSAPSRTDRGEVRIQSAASLRRMQDTLRRAGSGTPM